MTAAVCTAWARGSARWSFLRQSWSRPVLTGAIAPSGSRLARSLTAPVLERTGRPLTVLEVGAGTGAVTRVLLPLLAPGSRLDVVEVNPAFLPALRDLLTGAPVDARLHGVAFADAEPHLAAGYDVIVSALPFTNFDPGFVRSTLDRYEELLQPGGSLTWFAYLGSRHLRGLTGSHADRLRHARVEHLLAARGGSRHDVWGNLPPARVTRLLADRLAAG